MMAEPLRVLSLGAGVQSSTVLLMSCVGELPKLDAAIFADTGWEPKAVYAHLDWLSEFAAQHGIAVERVANGNIRDATLNGRVSITGLRQATMPFFTRSLDGVKDGMVRRQCTSDYKIKPIQRRLRELAGLKTGQRTRAGDVRIEQWFGISADEPQRMRTAEFSWISNRYPLIYDARMRRSDCLDWCASHGFPMPPRSACLGCPFHSDSEWRSIKSNPEEWDDVVAFDAAVRRSQGMRSESFLHAQRVPLDQVDLSTAEERGQLSMFGNECAGVCGV